MTEITTSTTTEATTTHSSCKRNPALVAEEVRLAEAYKQAVASYGKQSLEAEKAFEAIYNHFYDAVVYNSRRKLNSPELVEELVQETFVTVWERLNGNEEITYLYGLVSHSHHLEYASLMERQYKGKQLGYRPVLLSLDAALPGSHAVNSGAAHQYALTDLSHETAPLVNRLYDGSYNLEREVIARTEIEKVLELVKEMPSHYRTAVIGQVVDGKSMALIGSENGWTLDQVKKNLARGRKWLAERTKAAA